MITIEVFGPGCSKCQATEAVVRQALHTLGLTATVTHIRDPKEMAKARVLFTPAVRINGEVKCTGRVPQVAEVTSWLATAAAKADE
ncbi:MAG: thioredoxin family protein [Armatimonadota bacterium]|nr:thioredoxin family protein [Armatimonadota bacterium]